MGEQESRTAMLIGTAGVERLRQAGVAVFGVTLALSLGGWLLYRRMDKGT